MNVRFIDSIHHISKQDWESVAGKTHPFIRYEFLSALETRGDVSTDTGWKPHHALVYENDLLIAVMPTYLKQHSYGEFVFDFQWASAYQQHGLNYYPKLLSAIPFSPVTGPRIGIGGGHSEDVILDALLDAYLQHVKDKRLSSWHILFLDQAISEKLSDKGIPMRRAVHFQWLNKNYTSFEGFLSDCNSRHRKNIRKERNQIQSAGITLERIEGSAITKEHWQRFYHFYQRTYEKYSGRGGYLSPEFFYRIGSDIPEHLMMVSALKNGKLIAAALNLKDSTTLYGRYWGCDESYDFLHFETCYYQGIDYCIEKGLQRFDPGVQGEHKIQRGFRPVFTYSNHWINDSKFRDAINLFLQREDKHILHYKVEAENLLPFKQV
jgi:predicted N-acyltransferase